MAAFVGQVREADYLQLEFDLELRHSMQSSLVLLEREENVNWCHLLRYKRMLQRLPC